MERPVADIHDGRNKSIDDVELAEQRDGRAVGLGGIVGYGSLFGFSNSNDTSELNKTVIVGVVIVLTLSILKIIKDKLGEKMKGLWSDSELSAVNRIFKITNGDLTEEQMYAWGKAKLFGDKRFDAKRKRVEKVSGRITKKEKTQTMKNWGEQPEFKLEWWHGVVAGLGIIIFLTVLGSIFAPVGDTVVNTTQPVPEPVEQQHSIDNTGFSGSTFDTIIAVVIAIVPILMLFGVLGTMRVIRY